VLAGVNVFEARMVFESGVRESARVKSKEKCIILAQLFSSV